MSSRLVRLSRMRRVKLPIAWAIIKVIDSVAAERALIWSKLLPAVKSDMGRSIEWVTGLFVSLVSYKSVRNRA
jgi:hypothetical protein